MSKEKQCECCHEWWYGNDIKNGLCPNCYYYFKQLKQEIDLKINYFNLVRNIDKFADKQLAINELEKVKMMTEWKFSSIVDVVEYIDNQIKELKGE